MLGSEENVRARETRLKRPIVADLSKINVSEKHCRKPMDDHISFDDKETDPNHYLGALVILVSIAGVTIPNVLVDIESALNILMPARSNGNFHPFLAILFKHGSWTK